MMQIGLLGMSGVGKTYWSGKLAAQGFRYFGCDDMIASKLQDARQEPFRDLYDVGDWMGLPDEQGFQEKEELYLSLESETLLDITKTLADDARSTRPVVVDLTGSAVYASEAVLGRLRQSVVLVYLAITPEVYENMLAAYLRRPRPLIWRGLYARAPGQTRMASFQQSYPRLIAHREILYENYCDVRLEYALHRRQRLSVEDFIREIGERLSSARHPAGSGMASETSTPTPGQNTQKKRRLYG